MPESKSGALDRFATGHRGCVGYARPFSPVKENFTPCRQNFMRVPLRPYAVRSHRVYTYKVSRMTSLDAASHPELQETLNLIAKRPRTLTLKQIADGANVQLHWL